MNIEYEDSNIIVTSEKIRIISHPKHNSTTIPSEEVINAKVMYYGFKSEILNKVFGSRNFIQLSTYGEAYDVYPKKEKDFERFRQAIESTIPCELSNV